ncbi:carbon storage regulator [Xylanivirga thermophila]|jgi:carbon storage regulator|uniref:carbon storage regulator n=1 Tax=Xylanivirga thermophila TaxID=2496273 RepID=UPI00101D2E5C|nr:carbon storage regulator [Xylanivirga thermophila]
MLVLTRKKGEEILIGKDIRIAIVGVEGDKVKVGIDAPGEMAIVRRELVDEVRQVNKEAVNTKSISLSDIAKALKEQN